MHLHFLGICGTFMGSLAMLARELGHTVTGSDANVYPPMSTQLQQQGIVITEGYDPAHSCNLRTGFGDRRQRHEPRQPGGGIPAGCGTCPTPPARSGCASMCCRGAGCWRWPARTARPPPRACWRGCWITRA
jgi:hypothetical protein